MVNTVKQNKKFFWQTSLCIELMLHGTAFKYNFLRNDGCAESCLVYRFLATNFGIGEALGVFSPACYFVIFKSFRVTSAL